MADQPLLFDLNLIDRMYLAHLTNQPGYKVLVDIMEAACKRANDAVVKLDPEDVNIKDYDKSLAYRQQVARATNKFCADVLKSVEFHKQMGVAEEQRKELETTINRST